MTPSTSAPTVSARIALVALLVAMVVGAMALTSGNMSDLRVALPPLSRAMNWLEGMPVQLDMDHVAFFMAITFATRLLLPRLRWWWIFFGVVVLALGTELLQFWIPGRTPKLQDARDDLVGGAAGLLIGTLPLWLGKFAPQVVGLSGALLLAGVAVLPLQQWSPLGAFGFPVLLSDLLFAMAIGVRALAWAGGRAPLRLSGFHGWLLAYVAAMSLACLMAWPTVRSQESSGYMRVLPGPQLWVSMGKWMGVVYLATLAALVADITRDEAWMKRLVLTWIAAATVTALLSMAAIAGFYVSPKAEWLQPLLNYYGSLPPGPYPRVRALFNYASMMCNFLTIATCLLLAAKAAGWVAGRAFFALMVMFSIALAATLTPGLGAAALVLTAWGWWSLCGTRPKAAAGVMAMGMTVAVVMLAVTCVSLVSPLDEPSQRWRIWHQALQTCLAHPILGVGLGVPVVGVAFLDPSGGHQWLTDAHNTWLNVAGQAGVIGVLALVGLCVWLLRAGQRAARADQAGLAFALLLAFVCAFLYDGLTGSFEDARHIWVLIGLLAAMAGPRVIRTATAHFQAPLAVRVKRPLTSSTSAT